MKPRGFEFEEILTVDPSKSWFDMSYKNKFTANFGKLYPFYCEETMPGDRFKINSTVFARLQPLLAPVMQQCDIFSYFFYVPNRLVWNNWKKFQSNGDGTVKMANAASYVPPEHPWFAPAEYFANIVSSRAYLSYAIHRNGSDYFLCLANSSTGVPLNRDQYNKLLAFTEFMGVAFNGWNTTADGTLVIGVTSKSTNTYTLTHRYSIYTPSVGSTFDCTSAPNDGETVLVSSSSLAAADSELDKVNALPFFAYNKIYNEFFRSQDYIDELVDDCVDGENVLSYLGSPFTLQSKCFEHDYFTSILPDAQRGPDVTLSLAATEAPLFLDNKSASYLRPIDGTDTYPNWNMVGSPVMGTMTAAAAQVPSEPIMFAPSPATNHQRLQIDVTPHTKVDLSGISAITINALRYANTLQKYEEQLARSGSRYNEMLLALYGVESSDASIQRPIFLGASRTPVSINDVAQTSATDGPNALAQLAGRGIAVGDVNTDFYCEENGWIIGVLSVVPRTQYFQGLNRHLRKKVNLDYPVPMFAHLGEQEVYKEELFSTGQASDRNILGYLPRFSEFKYHSDEVHGEYRGSLGYWAMLRHVAPASYITGAIIDGNFLKADTMQYDAFADTSESDDHFILDVTNSVALLRSLPEYSTPQL